MNADSFTGQHRFIDVPASGSLITNLKYGKLEEPLHSGKYVLVVANCNDDGRNVTITGEYIWKSEHGFLPGK